MKQIWTVFVFTLKDAARKKAFKISTFILLLAAGEAGDWRQRKQWQRKQWQRKHRR